MLCKRPVGFVSFCHSAAVSSSPAVYKHFTHCSSPSHESRYARCSYVAVTVTVKGAFRDKTLPAAACTCAAARYTHTHMLGQRVLLHTNARTIAAFTCARRYSQCSRFSSARLFSAAIISAGPPLSLSLFLSGSCECLPASACP